MLHRLPIGIDDFRVLRERGLEYVDKTQLVCDILDRPGEQVLLLPRPRRFGKTLNLSMLRCFFEKRAEDLSPLFQGLRVFEAGEEYRAHFQRYPVLHLTFKDIKYERWERAWAAIRKKITDLFNEHRYLLDGGSLDDVAVRRYRQVLDETAGPELYDSALLDLSRYLHQAHGERVVILIDEYDEPIHIGYVHGYASEVLEFFRAFLTNGLKGNPHLQFSVMTGILRVARESIFSGLNNLSVYTLLRSEFSGSFGFTEPEVEALLERAGCLDLLDAVRRAYNGYVFGKTVIYNPWSVLSFLASGDKLTRSYWVSTSANELVQTLLVRHALDVEPDISTLLEGGAIERRLDEHVALNRLHADADALWSLLVFAGYLRAEQAAAAAPHEVPPYRLSIPNQEVREVFTGTFQMWMRERLDRAGGGSPRLVRALLGGDAALLQEQIQSFAESMLSYHDRGAPSPEQFYQGFVLGLLAVLEPGHRVRSNRESGKGRPDVLITPAQPGSPGVVLELKVARGRKTLEQALEEGMEQIRQNDYAAELRAAGAAPVHAFAVAFDGKQVLVRSARGDAA